MPYLRIPQNIFDRFSLKNAHVSILVFSVDSKNLNVGCTARFREIKREKLALRPPVRTPLRMLVSGKTRVPAHAHCTLVSVCCLCIQAFGAKSQRCKGFTVRKPSDNTFFSVFKPKHNLATVRTLLSLPGMLPFCFCARGISSAR